MKLPIPELVGGGSRFVWEVCGGDGRWSEDSALHLFKSEIELKGD